MRASLRMAVVLLSARCSRRREHPRSVADDPVARACRVAGVAQCKPLRLEPAAPGLDQQAGHRQVATGAVRAEACPFATFDGARGRRVETPGAIIVVVVREVRADYDQCFLSAP